MKTLKELIDAFAAEAKEAPIAGAELPLAPLTPAQMMHVFNQLCGGNAVLIDPSLSLSQASPLAAPPLRAIGIHVHVEMLRNCLQVQMQNGGWNKPVVMIVTSDKEKPEHERCWQTLVFLPSHYKIPGGEKSLPNQLPILSFFSSQKDVDPK